jgi:hypothetical protein
MNIRAGRVLCDCVTLRSCDFKLPPGFTSQTMRSMQTNLRTVSLILALLATICSCTSTSGPQSIDPKSFFPYHIGDTAIYRDTVVSGGDSLLIESTIGMTTLRGMPYYEVVRFRPGSNWRDTTYERVALNGNLFRYDRYADAEYCTLDFSKQSSTEPTPNQVADLVNGYGLTVKVPAGTFTSCIRTIDGNVEKTSRYFAPAVGLIRSSSMGGDFQLVYAVRAGKIYGKR